MAGREVTLCLKYPGSAAALQRLQRSYLECVVEHKAGSDAELQTRLPADLFSKYQLKGAATVADDEIVIQFTPRNAGVHCVRLFADTREICRPVPFLVTQRGETVNLPPDRPVQRPPPAAPPAVDSSPPTFYGLNNPRFPPAVSSPSPVPYSVTSEATTAAQTEPHRNANAGMTDAQRYTSDPDLSPSEQQRIGFSPQRASHVIAAGRSARPHSTAVPEPPGGIMSQPQGTTNFHKLYSSKNSGERVYGTRRGPLSIDYQSVVTMETLRMLGKEADLQMKVFRGGKAKRRCDICSKKVKTAKSVSLGEEDYCDPCFRRQFLLHSAIDHFMVPSIRECNVQVPINKRATKFITARKMIVDVNLRGLEPNDVRNAHEEFQKFDMENNSWIQRAVLMPVLKASLSLAGLHEREIKFLLKSQALLSTMSIYGLDDREEIHEIEFLGLLAFVTRERERLRASVNPRASGVFTRNDLEMAYAFRQHNMASHSGQQQMRDGVGRHGDQRVGQLDLQGESYPRKQRGSFIIPKSQTEESLGHRYSSLSPSPSKMAARNIRESFSSPQHLAGFTEPVQLFTGHHGNQFGHPPEPRPPQRRQSVISGEYVPLGDRLAARRAAAATKRASVVSRGDPTTDLAEEDQEEEGEEGLILPPDKDPSAQHRANSLIGKTPANKKQLMEDVNKELKLTGGEADGWMLY